MKTKSILLTLMLAIMLALTTFSAFAENTNPQQTVCVGAQPYRVISTGIPNTTYNWSIDVGVAGTDWTITPTNVEGNEISINWIIPGVYNLTVNTSANGCIGTPQTVEVTVVQQPIAPGLDQTSQPYPNVCEGTDVWATFTPGSGGVGCTDEFQYSYDNTNWLPYIPGTLISTTGQTNVYIQGRRAGCDATLGCNGTNWVLLATWNVTTLTVSVSIDPIAPEVCAGTAVTFTATGVNGGLTPQYTWFVNGTQMQQGASNTYTYTPANGDVVTCELLSSETCGSPNPALSNTATVTVNPVPVTSPIYHN